MPETPNLFQVGGQNNPVSGPIDLVITANVITPTALVNRVAAAGGLIKTITVPWPGFAGFIVLIAGTTPYTWDATANIAVAGTSTATGRAMLFVYDPIPAKWYPVVFA